MTEITPALSMSAYFLGRRIAGQRRKRALAINVLAATFDPQTGDAVFGENGTLSGTNHVIGYAGQVVRYENGHLIVEDTQ